MDTLAREILDMAPYLIIAFTMIYLFHEGIRFIKSRDLLMIQNRQYAAKAEAVTKKGGAAVQLQLQAAERFALFLERIAPDRLVMRLHQSGMSAKMLETEMLKAIREEFDYNLSQQIYVSEPTWKLIRDAKDDVVQFISATGKQMNDRSTGMDFTRKIFEGASKVEKLPSEIALQLLRQETRKLLG